MARFSLGIETGLSTDNYALNFKDDTLYLYEGQEHTRVIEGSWNDVYLWKNRINFNFPLFKIGGGDLILQGFGSQGQSLSGDFRITERFDPVDKEAAGYEYLYRQYDFGEIDFKTYDISVNLAYQILITPDGRENRDYYLFNSKVHSFLLPKIGYSYFMQKHSVSSSINLFSVQNYTDSYTSNWGGPFIGFESVNYISDNHKISFGGSFYYVYYDLAVDDESDAATLRSIGLDDDPAYDSFYLRKENSIEADATGNAYSLDLGYSYQPGNHISYDVNLHYISTRIKDGDTIYYYRDGSTSSDTINEANWDSFLISLGLTYNF